MCRACEGGGRNGGKSMNNALEIKHKKIICYQVKETSEQSTDLHTFYLDERKILYD